MNGPLLISMLPPERISDAGGAVPPHGPFLAVLLLAGLLLSLLLRPPGR